LGYPLFSEETEEKLYAKMHMILGDLKEYWSDMAKLPYYSKFVREHCTVAEKTSKNNFTNKLRSYLSGIESKSKHVRQ